MVTDFEKFVRTHFNTKEKFYLNSELKNKPGKFILNLTFDQNSNFNESTIFGTKFEASKNFWFVSYESDDLTIDEQLANLEILRADGFEPTFACYSGYNPNNDNSLYTGHSIHLIFVLKDLIDSKVNKSEYQKVQIALAKKFNGDLNAATSHRRMRHPGYADNNINQLSIPTARNTYTLENLRSYLADYIDDAVVNKVKINPNDITVNSEEVFVDSNNNEITINDFIESNKHSVAIRCPSPTHPDSSPSAYLIWNTDRTLITCACSGCSHKKYYKPASIDLNDWHGLNKINQTLAGKYIDGQKVLDIKSKFIFLKAPTGSGKTELIRSLDKNYKKILYIMHLRNLSRNIQGRLSDLGFKNYINFVGERIPDFDRIIITPNSISKVSDYDYDCIVVDEAVSVRDMIVSDLIEAPIKTCDVMFNKINKAKKVFVMDANLYYDCAKWFSNKSDDITVYEHKFNKGLTINIMSPDEAYRQIRDYDDSKVKLVVGYTSKNKLLTDAKLQKEKNFVTISGENSDEMRDEIKNINELAKTNNISYSPSVNTGVDIQTVVKYFIQIENGPHSNFRNSIQLFGRVRNPLNNEINVVIETKVYNKTENKKQIESDILSGLRKDIEIAFNHNKEGLAQIKKDPRVLEAFVDKEFQQNYSMNHYKELMVEYFEQIGKIENISNSEMVVGKNVKAMRLTEKSKAKKAKVASILSREIKGYDIAWAESILNPNVALIKSTSEKETARKIKIIDQYGYIDEELIYDVLYNNLGQKTILFADFISQKKYGSESIEEKQRLQILDDLFTNSHRATRSNIMCEVFEIFNVNKDLYIDKSKIDFNRLEKLEIEHFGEMTSIDNPLMFFAKLITHMGLDGNRVQAKENKKVFTKGYQINKESFMRMIKCANKQLQIGEINSSLNSICKMLTKGNSVSLIDPYKGMELPVQRF